MNLQTRLDLVRPFTLLAPMLGTAAAAFVASGAGAGRVEILSLLAAFASAALATGASNAWNQAFDAEQDRVNKPGRPVPRGDATEGGALRFGHVLAVLALLLGALASLGFLACVAVGIASTWIYSAPPLRTRRYLLGALLTIAIPRGLLVPVAGWALVGEITDLEPWLLGSVTGLFVLGAAATKDFADVAGDRQAGCVTLPIALGPARAARLIAPFLFLPFVLYLLYEQAGMLSAGTTQISVLTAVLCAGGLYTAWQLVRDPDGFENSGRNHPAWTGMYLLMLGAHVGTALAYNL